MGVLLLFSTAAAGTLFIIPVGGKPGRRRRVNRINKENKHSHYQSHLGVDLQQTDLQALGRCVLCWFSQGSSDHFRPSSEMKHLQNEESYSRCVKSVAVQLFCNKSSLFHSLKWSGSPAHALQYA